MDALYDQRAPNMSSGLGDLSSQHVPRTSEEAQAQIRSKQRLGQYSVLKTLGEGSFGKVKLAVHQVSGQKVALKIINRRKLINRDMAGRVEREIQYLQLLRHPHIIKLYTVITTPVEIIMVLECAGGELFDYIVAHGKTAEDTARRFFQQIICAVEYCHRHKIVHRDLKPENLLLDDYLNVKIADFGLSNIMTDGNFLKTSCGSPNYAAPEVIGGKLYAGPEVDVWSCGVILYVLLVGKLPFDDEYIPSLFKKISQGTYTIPSYLSPGAASLIRRMLVVNSVQRITIQEIRQDPWFTKNLAEYLQPPVEDFIETGVNPNKAINPKTLAPGKPSAVQEKIHEDVIGKLGKTMGYAKDDVQDALGKDEPSTIKDAYLIVRENQMMKENPRLSNNRDLQPFLAQSPPPAWNPEIPSSPRPRPDYAGAGTAESALTPDVGRSSMDKSGSAGPDENGEATYKSSVGVLPSSLPTYHRAYMARIKVGQTGKLESQRHDGEDGRERTAGANHLKPHSKSQISVLEKADHKPERLTPMPSKKPRPTKWQFGIRSRNEPVEAMHCIYRALQRLGAEWEEPDREDDSFLGKVNVGDNATEGHWSDDEGDADSKTRSSDDESSQRRDSYSHEEDYNEEHRHNDRGSLPGPRSRNPGSGNNSDSEDACMPADPWLIRCRWIKDGLSRSDAGMDSARTSTTNLVTPDPTRRSSNTSPVPGGSGEAERSGRLSSNGAAPGSNADTELTDKVYVYMDIQLYQIEKGFYLVDFKCAGYERIVEEEVDAREAGRKLKRTRGVGRRFAEKEKEVCSPFPFLDLASKLIIALASD